MVCPHYGNLGLYFYKKIIFTKRFSREINPMGRNRFSFAIAVYYLIKGAKWIIV